MRHDELKALAGDSEFLRLLDDDDLHVLARVAEECARPAGHVLFDVGDAGECAFLVLEGTVSIRAGDGAPSVPDDRAAGRLVGVVSFARGSPRTASAVCTTDCRLARLTRPAFNELFTASPETWRRLERLALDRTRRAELSKHLDRVFGPFGSLLPFVIEEVSDNIEWQTLRSGETLYEYGDDADAAFLLISG